MFGIRRATKEFCATLREISDENSRLKAENAKLKELVSDMFEEIESGGFDPMVERHGNSTVYYDEDLSWRVGIRERVRELGIEEKKS